MLETCIQPTDYKTEKDSVLISKTEITECKTWKVKNKR